MFYSKYYAAIIGASGQDGFFMSRYLLKKKKKILLIVRSPKKNVLYLKSKYKKLVHILVVEEFNFDKYSKILEKYTFNKVFFFAGYSKIPNNLSETKKCKLANYEIIKDFLYACLFSNKKPKILYLSSGEIFGMNQKKPSVERSQYKVENCYSKCKLKSVELIKQFRMLHNFFIVNAICYNHESIYTPKNHILRKILNLLQNKNNRTIKIFNSEDKRNISHIYDFLPLFDRTLSSKHNTDYVFANKENISIRSITLFYNKFFHKKIIFMKKNIKSISRLANNSKILRDFNYIPIYNSKNLLRRILSYHKKKQFIK